MSVANGTPTNLQALLDQNYIVTANLPNAANTVNTSGMDLIQAAPYPTTNRILVNFVVTGGNGGNNKNINVAWQQSNDNGNWTNVNFRPAPLFQVVDNNGAGQNNANVTLAFDPAGWRYIRGQMLGEANGGTGVGGTFTMQLLF